MIILNVKGNLLDTDCKYIAHGVNCQNAMGSGVAKAIYTRYPEVKSAYHEHCGLAFEVLGQDSEELLGSVQPVETEDLKIVFNMFTQLNYGRDGEKYVSYDAIYDCFSTLDLHLHKENKPVAIPKIGSGLAGGSWTAIEAIINSATPNLEIIVYEI